MCVCFYVCGCFLIFILASISISIPISFSSIHKILKHTISSYIIFLEFQFLSFKGIILSNISLSEEAAQWKSQLFDYYYIGQQLIVSNSRSKKMDVSAEVDCGGLNGERC